MTHVANSAPRTQQSGSDRECCPQCGAELRVEVVMCPDCQSAVGYPNVRVASAPEERAALRERYAAAVDAAQRAGCRDKLEVFERRVSQQSHAVINRHPKSLASMLSSEDDISHNYYRQVDAGLRLGNSDKWNSVRVIADNLFFPGYYRDIRFAALSLTSLGLPSYGACSLVLKDQMIQNRASVFEKNTIIWINDTFSDKEDLFALREVPPGFRASWMDRGQLAVAKLYSGIVDGRESPEEVLIKRADSTEGDDFIEVHIWGPLTKNCVEEISLPAGRDVEKRERIHLRVIMDYLQNRPDIEMTWSVR